MQNFFHKFYDLTPFTAITTLPRTFSFVTEIQLSTSLLCFLIRKKLLRSQMMRRRLRGRREYSGFGIGNEKIIILNKDNNVRLKFVPVFRNSFVTVKSEND